MDKHTVRLGPRLVGDFGLPYIIAEIGSNHNGEMELAKQLKNMDPKAKDELRKAFGKEPG